MKWQLKQNRWKADLDHWMNKRFLEEKLIRTYIHWTGKKEILPFVIAWMDLEIIILSEVTVKGKYHMISLICGIYWTK